MGLYSGSQREIIYFADPMCSWCWGFSPVIERVAKQFGDDLPIRLVMGGLRAGNKVPMDPAMKDDIKGHWRHVEEKSGQGFDYSFFERDGFIYDTGPACRAVVAVRLAFPGRELSFLGHLHRSFYREAIDLTSGPELLRVAVDFGLDEQLFAQTFEGERCSSELAADFQHVSANGIRAFPAVLGGNDTAGYMSVTHGWRSFEEIAPALERLINMQTLPNGLMPGVGH